MNRPHFGRLAPRPVVTALLIAALAPLTTALAGAQAGPAQLTTRAYLPLIVRPSLVAVEFATSVNVETFEPIAPSNTFPGGTDLIYVAARIEGLAGSTYRVDFTTPSGQTLTGTSLTAQSNAFRIAPSYCFTRTTCDIDRTPLPSGVYTAAVYINGAVAAQGQFTIQ